MSGASGAVDLGTEEGRAFLQERLAFFGGVGFVFQSGFFVLGQIALALIVPGLVSGPWSVSRALALVSDLSGQLLWLGALARGSPRPALPRASFAPWTSWPRSRSALSRPWP